MKNKNYVSAFYHEGIELEIYRHPATILLGDVTIFLDNFDNVVRVVRELNKMVTAMTEGSTNEWEYGAIQEVTKSRMEW